MKAFRFWTIAATLAFVLCPQSVRASDGDDIPTLETVVAEADSIQTFWMMLAPMWGVGFTPEYDQMDPIGSEGD